MYGICLPYIHERVLYVPHSIVLYEHVVTGVVIKQNKLDHVCYSLRPASTSLQIESETVDFINNSVTRRHSYLYSFLTSASTIDLSLCHLIPWKHL